MEIMENNINNDNNEEENKNKNSEEKINFIVFDTIFTLSDNNKYRFIVKFDKNNQMKIGRGLENNLVLNEITVSRYHCLITLQRNAYGNLEIKFEDENSKFGSLVLIQKNRIEIIKGKPLYIQISNVYLIIQYKKSSSILSCCNAEVVEDKNTYEKMNYKAVKKKNIVNVLNEIDSDNEEDNKIKNDKNENSNCMILLVKNKTENQNMKTISKLNNEKTNNIEEKEKNKDDDNNGKDNEEVYVDDD
jgi:pSer/pThr/pTyr-binding forkhead associated (FHA) protein